MSSIDEEWSKYLSGDFEDTIHSSNDNSKNDFRTVQS